MRFLDAKQAPGAPSNKMAPGAPATKQGEGAEIRASAAARGLATQHGVDLTTLKGRGQGGTITVADVWQAVDAAKDAAKQPAGDGDGAAQPGGTITGDGSGDALPPIGDDVPAGTVREVPPGDAVRSDEMPISDVHGSPLIGEPVNHTEAKSRP